MQAETEEADANEGFQIENGVLKKYLGVEMDVIIPKGVTSIGERAFGYTEDWGFGSLAFTIVNVAVLTPK